MTPSQMPMTLLALALAGCGGGGVVVVEGPVCEWQAGGMAVRWRVHR
jgi:hypothetical protein